MVNQVSSMFYLGETRRTTVLQSRHGRKVEKGSPPLHRQKMAKKTFVALVKQGTVIVVVPR
jgi:hypothetical protein